MPGICACGCEERFQAGAEIARGPGGWCMAACLETPWPEPGSQAEVEHVLRLARDVAARKAAP